MSFGSLKFGRATVMVLLGLLLAARLIAMAGAPLVDSTEPRYAEIARKMAELNDWVTPWFEYGTPFWGKPPLSFWITAISLKLFGVNEFAARLPHFIFALAIVGLVGLLTWRRDRDAALPAVACLAGSILYFISSAAVMTDIELTLGTTLVMAGFWFALADVTDRNDGGRWWASLLFFGGLIVGLLAKGPVAVVLAGTPLVLWTAYYRRWRDVWRCLPWISGTLLTLLIVLPWYWLAEQRTPGFLNYFLIGEHWHRFVTPGWSGDRYGGAHRSPIGTIWVFAFLGALPWSILLPVAALRWRKTGGLRRNDLYRGVFRSVPDARAWQNYLLIWMLTPLLFFTASRNIIWTYVLPGLPAAALMAGGWLADQERLGREVNRLLSIGLLIVLLLTCAAAVQVMRPAVIDHKSLKALVTAYDRAVAQQAAPSASASSGVTPPSSAALIFINYPPASGHFYSRGRALWFGTDDEAWVRTRTDAAYVATPSGDRFIASAAARTPPRTVTRIGHYGNYDLLFVAPSN